MSEEQKRTLIRPIRLRPDEVALLTRVSRASGIPVSDWLRTHALRAAVDFLRRQRLEREATRGQA